MNGPVDSLKIDFVMILCRGVTRNLRRTTSLETNAPFETSLAPSLPLPALKRRLKVDRGLRRLQRDNLHREERKRRELVLMAALHVTAR